MEEVSGKDLKNFFFQWLYVKDEPILRITSSPGADKSLVKITVEQVQSFLYNFKIELGIEDSRGSRMVVVPVSGKKASLEISEDKDLKITPDPDVKLLFRPAEQQGIK
jgi:hypothetical protein